MGESSTGVSNPEAAKTAGQARRDAGSSISTVSLTSSTASLHFPRIGSGKTSTRMPQQQGSARRTSDGDAPLCNPDAAETAGKARRDAGSGTSTATSRTSSTASLHFPRVASGSLSMPTPQQRGSIPTSEGDAPLFIEEPIGELELSEPRSDTKGLTETPGCASIPHYLSSERQPPVQQQQQQQQHVYGSCLPQQQHIYGPPPPQQHHPMYSQGPTWYGSQPPQQQTQIYGQHPMRYPTPPMPQQEEQHQHQQQQQQDVFSQRLKQQQARIRRPSVAFMGLRSQHDEDKSLPEVANERTVERGDTSYLRSFSGINPMNARRRPSVVAQQQKISVFLQQISEMSADELRDEFPALEDELFDNIRQQVQTCPANAIAHIVFENRMPDELRSQVADLVAYTLHTDEHSLMITEKNTKRVETVAGHYFVHKPGLDIVQHTKSRKSDGLYLSVDFKIGNHVSDTKKDAIIFRDVDHLAGFSAFVTGSMRNGSFPRISIAIEQEREEVRCSVVKVLVVVPIVVMVHSAFQPKWAFCDGIVCGVATAAMMWLTRKSGIVTPVKMGEIATGTAFTEFGIHWFKNGGIAVIGGTAAIIFLLINTYIDVRVKVRDADVRKQGRKS